jgi:hypothetical protein
MTTQYGGGTPAIGSRVLTADGDELGKVKEISGNCFKVDARMQPDYWLATDCIASGSGSDVKLSFTKDNLGDAKQDGPEHKGLHPHS